MIYKLVNDLEGNFCGVKLIMDNGKEMSIPFDPANTDYQEYIKWTKASPKNVAIEAD